MRRVGKIDEGRMRQELFQRGASISISNINVDERTVELSFASEHPVERWYGIEVLEMTPNAADLNRLNNGGALLSDHNTRSQIGRVVKAWVGDDKRGHAIVQFSQRQAAQEEFQDVIDNIRTNVSFGYRVHEYTTKKGEADKPDVITVTRWEAYEISLVAIPADPTVGVGRSQPDEDGEDAVENTERGIIMENETAGSAQGAPSAPTAAPSAPATVAFAREDQIFEYGRRFNIDPGLVKRHAFNPAGTVETLRDDVAKAYAPAVTITSTPTGESPASRLDLTEKETRRYSIARAILAQADNDWRSAEFERECNDEIAKRVGRESSGFFVPQEVQNVRDLSATGGNSSGGYLVSTDHMPQSFIELLRSKAIMLSQGGVQVMSDLVGNPSIPRQDGAATGYWVAEGVPPAESQLVLGQLTMSPKTCGAMTEFTRQLLIQSAPSIDQLVKSDIAAVLARTIDTAIIDGSGTAGQPTGILNTTGVDAITLSGSGSAFDWSDALEFESSIAEGNAPDATKWITRPSVKGVLKGRPKIGTTYPVFLINDDNTLNGYPVVTTTQCPANTMMFGDFSTVIMGEWGILEIEANKYGTSFGHGGIQVRGLHMVDVAVRYPSAIKKTEAFL